MPVLTSLRRRRSARNSCPTFPLAIKMREASCTSRSGTRGRKRGCVNSSILELASGWRSMLFGVKTISGLRHGRRACRRSMWKYCTAVRVLAGEPDRRAFEKQGAKGQRLGETVIDRALPVPHFGALLKQFHDFRMNVKTLRHADEAVGNFREFFASQSRVNFIFRSVTAMRVRRPVIRKLAETWNLFQRPRFRLFFFVLFADGFDDSRRVNAGGLRINLPMLRMVLDAFVVFRLCDGWVVNFAVAVTS